MSKGIQCKVAAVEVRNHQQRRTIKAQKAQNFINMVSGFQQLLTKFNEIQKTGLRYLSIGHKFPISTPALEEPEAVEPVSD